MNSITLPSGTVVTRTKERDMDGYFYIKLEKETTVLNFKTSLAVHKITQVDVRSNHHKEKNLGKCAITGYNINDDEPKKSTLYLSTESARALEDFLLKRKLRKFKTELEFYKFCETDEYKNGIFGTYFFIKGQFAMYEYEEEYKETNYELKREALHEEFLSELRVEAELLGLPKLKGSKKQIDWAEQLRNKYFATTNEKELAPRCKSVKTAKWWIENRFKLGIEQKKRSGWGY